MTVILQLFGLSQIRLAVRILGAVSCSCRGSDGLCAAADRCRSRQECQDQRASSVAALLGRRPLVYFSLSCSYSFTSSIFILCFSNLPRSCADICSLCFFRLIHIFAVFYMACFLSCPVPFFKYPVLLSLTTCQFSSPFVLFLCLDVFY